MSQNMSSTNEAYEAAAQKYSAAADKYTGNAGYANSLQQASIGAAQQAGAARNSAQAAARNAGMSKAQAAAAGTQAASQASQSAFSTQQNAAASMGNKAVDTAGTIASNEQAEGQNRYDRAWGNVTNGVDLTGKALSSAGSIIGAVSDNRLKDYVKITDEFFSKKPKSLESLKINMEQK